jgi:probable addiction module antidote protein
MRHYRDFKDYHLDKLRDPEDARAYLELALEEYAAEGDIEEFLVALRDVAEAQGGIGELARHTTLNRQNLYKALSATGNPRLKTIDTILHTLGFRLAVAPLEPDRELT